MKSQIDPKLEKAYKEIEAIQKKYDVGAFVSLASKTHTRYGLMPPTWSIAQWETEPITEQDSQPSAPLRIRNTHLAKGEKEKRTEETCHFLFTVRDTCFEMAKQMQMVYELLSKKMVIEHVNQVTREKKGS